MFYKWKMLSRKDHLFHLYGTIPNPHHLPEPNVRALICQHALKGSQKHTIMSKLAAYTTPDEKLTASDRICKSFSIQGYVFLGLLHLEMKQTTIDVGH